MVGHMKVTQKDIKHKGGVGKTLTQQHLYLFKIWISYHTLQAVDYWVPLHRRQGLPRDFAGVIIQTLHFRSWRVKLEMKEGKQWAAMKTSNTGNYLFNCFKKD